MVTIRNLFFFFFSITCLSDCTNSSSSDSDEKLEAILFTAFLFSMPRTCSGTEPLKPEIVEAGYSSKNYINTSFEYNNMCFYSYTEKAAVPTMRKITVISPRRADYDLAVGHEGDSIGNQTMWGWCEFYFRECSNGHDDPFEEHEDSVELIFTPGMTTQFRVDAWQTGEAFTVELE